VRIWFPALAAGARYEGQWNKDAKHGEGLFVFEDNSVWPGMWANDQPVETNNKHFAAHGNCPQVYVQDLLDLECNAAFAAKGALFMQRVGFTARLTIAVISVGSTMLPQHLYGKTLSHIAMCSSHCPCIALQLWPQLTKRTQHVSSLMDISGMMQLHYKVSVRRY
jgi:hypothetical protein